MKNPPRTRCLRQLAVLAVALGGGVGCRHIGPDTILDDRVAYNDAILTTWKQQTLLNVVRTRYGDIPEFVEVPSIVNGFEHSRSVNGSFGSNILPNNSLLNALTLGVGGNRTVSDRPTVTYLPQTGNEFTRNLMNPLPPSTVLNLIESGYPADVVLELTVESINGVRNLGFTGGLQTEDPAFQQVLHTLKKAQESGYVSLRVKPGGDKAHPDVLMSIRRTDIPPELAEELAQMRRLLRMDPEVTEFKIVYGMLPAAKDEIAFRTRSIRKVFNYLALQVRVPEAHVVEGRAPNIPVPAATEQPQFTVHSGCEPPCDSFTAVQYRGYWFWVDDTDFNSKRTMNYLKVLLALANADLKEAAPLLTIRAN